MTVELTAFLPPPISARPVSKRDVKIQKNPLTVKPSHNAIEEEKTSPLNTVLEIFMDDISDMLTPKDRADLMCSSRDCYDQVSSASMNRIVKNMTKKQKRKMASDAEPLSQQQFTVLFAAGKTIQEHLATRNDITLSQKKQLLETGNQRIPKIFAAVGALKAQ